MCLRVSVRGVRSTCLCVREHDNGIRLCLVSGCVGCRCAFARSSVCGERVGSVIGGPNISNPLSETGSCPSAKSEKPVNPPRA